MIGAMRKSTHTPEYLMLRQHLASLRVDAGMSQRQLAAALRVPHSWVAKVESGERRIDLIEFGWFCQACGTDAAQAAGEVLGGVMGKGPATRKRQGGKS